MEPSAGGRLILAKKYINTLNEKFTACMREAEEGFLVDLGRSKRF